MLKIREGAVILVSPDGNGKELTSPVLQGVRSPEIELLDKNLQRWVGFTHTASREQVISSIVRVLFVVRSDVRNRAFPLAPDGEVLQAIDGATYNEVSRDELYEFATYLYDHICTLPATRQITTGHRKHQPRGWRKWWPIGRDRR